MPRPTSQDLTRVNLQTNQAAAPDLGVFQSLNVQARSSRGAEMAQGLADVLGVATPIANDQIERLSEKRTTKGIADASLGRIDNEKLKRDIAYADGVEHVQTKQKIFSARAEWAEHYAQNVDKTIPTAEVARVYDDFMKERLGEVAETNPKMAAKMAPEYIEGMQQLVVGHQAQLTKQHIVLAENVMQQEIADAATRGVPVDFPELVRAHYQLTGDLVGSSTTAINAIGQIAVQQGKPELLSQLPTTITLDNGKSVVNADFTSEQRERISQFRQAADAQWVKNHYVERTVQKSGIEKGWLDTLSAGGTIPWADLEAQMKVPLEDHPLFTQDELISYYQRNLAAQEAQKDTVMFGGMSPDKPYYMQQGMLDADGKVITKERIQNQVNREVESTMQSIVESSGGEVPAPVAMAIAAREVTATEAYPYEPLVSTFINVPLDDKQTFANVADAYAELPITQRNKYVPDADRRALFERYIARRDAVGGKASVEELATADPELERRNLEANRATLTKIEAGIGDEYLERSFLPWNDSVQVKELHNSPYAVRSISEGVRLRVARHGMAPDTAREAATKDFLQGHILTKTQHGYRAIPRVAGVTDLVGEGIDWIERQLPEVGKAKGVEIPKGSYLQFDPTSRDNAEMVVAGPDGMLIAPGVLRFPLHRIERTYRANRDTGWQQLREESTREQQNRAREEQRQLDRAFGRDISIQPKL